MYRTGCSVLAVDFRVPAGHAFLTHVNAVFCALVGCFPVRMLSTMSHVTLTLFFLPFHLSRWHDIDCANEHIFLKRLHELKEMNVNSFPLYPGAQPARNHPINAGHRTHLLNIILISMSKKDVTSILIFLDTGKSDLIMNEHSFITQWI